MSARRIFVVRLGLIAAFGLVAAVDLASAQAITTGTIETVVVDTQDAVLPGATLTLRDVERGTTATLVSDGTGRARFLAIPVGTYEIRAELQHAAADRAVTWFS